MTDDATEWVTVKVPAADRDAAKDARPTGATHGDCLVAGARTLADGHAASDGDLVLGDGYEQVADRLAAAVADEVAVGEGADADAVAARVVERFDYAALADTLAEQLEARLR